MTVSIVELKAKASEIVARAERGEPITITRNGKPVAQMKPALTAGERAERVAWVKAQVVATSPPGTCFTPEEIKEMVNEGRR